MISILDKNTALVLIDLQKGIVQAPIIHPIESILNNAQKLVAAFHKTNLPVIIINVNPSGAAWTKTRKQGQQSTAPMPEEWLEIVPEIGSKPGDIFITKHTWNAFYETALGDILKQHAITQIVIGGISTSIGVEGTARAASERGFNIAFAADAMSDLNAEAHKNSMERIFPRMGEIDTTERIISLLGRNTER